MPENDPIFNLFVRVDDKLDDVVTRLGDVEKAIALHQASHDQTKVKSEEKRGRDRWIVQAAPGWLAFALALTMAGAKALGH